jgi:hypothetical protein
MTPSNSIEQTARARGMKPRSEDGAVAVISALVLTVLLLFAALVIDLGALRADTSLNQSVSDLAAAAAGQQYSASETDSAYGACLEAVAFAEANLGRTFGDASPDCSVFETGDVCDDGTVSTAVYTSGPYTLRITNPVLDSNPLMQGDLYGENVDGEPCDRVGVSLTRDRDFWLAGAGGGPQSGEATRGAVVRGLHRGDGGQFASLIILQQDLTTSNCPTLMKQGNSDVLVQGITHNGVDYPGIITIDAETPSGACDDKVIDWTGGGAGSIRAQNADGSDGHIFSYALSLDADDPDVYEPNPRLQPNPEGGSRVTRAPVDHLYNCLPNYPTDKRWSPNHASSVSPLEGCDPSEYDGSPHLKSVHDELAAGQLSRADVEAETNWGIIGPGGDADCNHSGTLSGKTYWFVDCAPWSPANLTINGASAVVTRARVEVGTSNNNYFRINGTDDGTIFFVQDGHIDVTAGNADMDLRDTFVYVENGPVRSSANAKLIWRAPLSPSDCTTFDILGTEIPSGQCFAPLALWSNSNAEHEMGGGGIMDIAGSFYTPNAQPFRLRGTSGQTLDEAQFFTARLRLAGNPDIVLRPNPDTNIPVPLTGGGLIR